MEVEEATLARFRRIHIIVNPASGHDVPVLSILNRVFRENEVAWDVSVTHGAGDARRLAREAVAAGVDLVAGYGGDGTLMEIANGLVDSDIPLGVLPGGTGNSVARELNIPLDLAEAAGLLCRGHNVRHIDLGHMTDRYFMLHLYVGLQPSQRAERELKNSVGVFAYLLSALRVLKDPQVTLYTLTVDGRQVEEEGIVCFVFNALNMGVDLPYTRTIRPDDGLLDLILVKKASLAALATLLEHEDRDQYLQHWRGRQITVRPETVQDVWLDGEAGGKTPVTAVAVPRALRVVAPSLGVKVKRFCHPVSEER
jgi:YegS/Rv2252/BmrU family lipid kinase